MNNLVSVAGPGARRKDTQNVRRYTPGLPSNSHQAFGKNVTDFNLQELNNHKSGEEDMNENVYGEIDLQPSPNVSAARQNIIKTAKDSDVLLNFDFNLGEKGLNKHNTMENLTPSSTNHEFECVARTHSNFLISEDISSSRNTITVSSNTMSDKHKFIPVNRHKKRQHVYQTITFNNQGAPLIADTAESKTNSIKSNIPPRVPHKPHYLRAHYNDMYPPKLPPKIVNTNAVMRRKQLNEEFFENIRRSMDISLSDDEETGFHDEAISVRMPGTESHPYWTISDVASNNTESSSTESPTGTHSPKQENTSGLNILTNSDLNKLRRQEFVQSLKALKQCGWYWGNMSWEDAEAMLAQRPNEEGVFLVRDSQDPLHILTLTIRSLEMSIHHIRIQHTQGKFQLYDSDRGVSRGAADCVRHPNIVTFIKLAMKHSKSGTFIYFVKTRNMGEPPVQIRLLTPISRFSCVKSLKYYTRFVIRDTVPYDSIALLQIPPALKEYLLNSPYFDSNEDFQCALQS